MENDTSLRLEAKLAELLEDSQKIQNQADAEGRDLTPEELAKIQANTAAFKTTKSDLEARKELEAQAAAMASPEPSATAAPVAGTPSFTGGTRADAKHGMFGFKSSSEWLGAVKAHAFGRTDQRLMNAVTTYGAEGIGADGGFMVPPDFSAAVRAALPPSWSRRPSRAFPSRRSSTSWACAAATPASWCSRTSRCRRKTSWAA